MIESRPGGCVQEPSGQREQTGEAPGGNTRPIHGPEMKPVQLSTVRMDWGGIGRGQRGSREQLRGHCKSLGQDDAGLDQSGDDGNQLEGEVYF